MSVLQFGDLLVEFGPKTDTLEAPDFFSARQRPKAPGFPTPADTEISVIQQQTAQEALERDEVTLREEQLAMLLLENPQEAERLLIDEKLDEELPNGSTDGSESAP